MGDARANGPYGDSGHDRRGPASERRLAELEKAENARQEFIANLSHELRNPIQAIHTNALLVKSRTRDPELLRPAEAIDRQVNRLSRILDDLLDVVKLARGEDLSFRAVDLHQVVSGALEATRRSMDMHRRELAVHSSDTPLFVRADAGRLQQAIGHVLANAVKFSGQQGEIALRVFEQDGMGVVSVRDRGVGLAPGDLTDLFKRPSQRAPRQSTTGGLGLGLHIANEVLILHEGRIEARSEGPGKGAEFLLSVPLTGERPVAEAPSRGHVDEGESLRILVVDDNRDAADSLATLLELNGHTGLVAYDGESALDKIEKMRPHVALVDIGMPSMSGYEVARRISQSARGRKTLLVAVTGWGMGSDRARSKEAGFDYHLTKPVDYDTLAALLSTAARGI